jgi:DNA (cytosine-5)-methyltransferase 1
LFSGIGGLDLSANWAGIETVAFVEMDIFCQKILSKHWPDVTIYSDVSKMCRRVYDCLPENNDGCVECPRCLVEFGECECIGTDQFLDIHGYVDIIYGGFPCQPYSVNGKRRGHLDERDMWNEIPRIAAELDPRWIVTENVSGSINSVLDKIIVDLERLNYEVWPVVFPALAVGAEHTRERVFCVAHSKSKRMEGLRTKRIVQSQPLDRPILPIRTCDGQWKIEPDLRRTVHGVSNWVDRLRVLGNAVVPHQAYPIFKSIVDLESLNAG